jgi:hypothetical protein
MRTQAKHPPLWYLDPRLIEEGNGFSRREQEPDRKYQKQSRSAFVHCTGQDNDDPVNQPIITAEDITTTVDILARKGRARKCIVNPVKLPS